MQITFERLDALVEIATFHNLVALLARGPYKVEHAEAVNAALNEVLIRHPGGIVVTSLLDGPVPPLFTARTPMRELIARLGDRLLLAMPILDGNGLESYARVAFLRGLQLVINRPTLVIARSVDEAVRRAAPLVRRADGVQVPHGDVVAFFAACEERLGRVTPA